MDEGAAGQRLRDMMPYLERTLDLSRDYSSYFAPYKHVADPHIDDADEGMTAASTRTLFGELKRQLVPMVRAICEQPAADDSSLRQTFAKAAQFNFAACCGVSGLRSQARPARPHPPSFLQSVFHR
jgi:Zn-dependent M32 family carboxypeptidase